MTDRTGRLTLFFPFQSLSQFFLRVLKILMSKCALTNLKAQVANFLPCLKDVKTRKHGTAFPTPDTKQHGPGGRSAGRIERPEGKTRRFYDFIVCMQSTAITRRQRSREVGPVMRTETVVAPRFICLFNLREPAFGFVDCGRCFSFSFTDFCSLFSPFL